MTYKLNQKTWASFKSLVARRNLHIYQVSDDASYYLLVANDGNIVIECVLKKTDTTSKSDYESNYQSDNTKVHANGDYSDDD